MALGLEDLLINQLDEELDDDRTDDFDPDEGPDQYQYCTEGREPLDTGDYGPHEPPRSAEQWRNLYMPEIRLLIFERGFTHEEVMGVYAGDVPETWLFSIIMDLKCSDQLVRNQAVRDTGTPIDPGP